MALEAQDVGSKNESLKPMMFSAVKSRPFVEAPMAYDTVPLYKVAFRLHLGSSRGLDSRPATEIHFGFAWELYFRSVVFGAEEVTCTVHPSRKIDQEFCNDPDLNCTCDAIRHALGSLGSEDHIPFWVLKFNSN
ncbi:hypothetical protein U1Q18_027586 [Sarracenia purpurea var. burkii]